MFKCVSNIKVENSSCLKQCSGVIVTSYEQNNIVDPFIDIYGKLSKLSDYLLDYIKRNDYRPGTVGEIKNQFKGF